MGGGHQGWDIFSWDENKESTKLLNIKTNVKTNIEHGSGCRDIDHIPITSQSKQFKSVVSGDFKL